MEQMGMPPQRPPQTFQLLRDNLKGSYEIRDVTLAGPVDADIDVLLLCGPADLDAKAVQAIDQFVMRGGALVALDGKYRLAPSPTGIAVEKVTTGLDGLFEAWGIKVPDQMVLDTKSDTFPIPKIRDYGEELEMVPYPYFPQITGSRVGASLVTGGIPGAVLHFVSPVEAAPKVGTDDREVDVVLESSSESWLSNSTQVGLGEDGAPPKPPDEARGEHPLAVTVLGNLATTIKKGAEADPKAKIIERTSSPVRIVVFGSSVFATDALQQHADQFGQELAKAGILMVHNAVDWAVADTDLLAIRARNNGAHALTLEPEKHETWRIINAVIALLALAAVIAMAWLRRRAVRPVIGGAS
jgi:ABC-2 type transport system permease protein